MELYYWQERYANGLAPKTRHEGARDLYKSETAESPLVVDLDGTLVRSDMLLECIAAVLRKPTVLLRVPLWLLRGKAHLKAELSKFVSINVRTLPYNTEVLQYLQAEKSRGRPIVLATGSDRKIADQIAAHLALFDEVIASDSTNNLTGKRKAAALCARFGKGAFSYAGNGGPDIEVWRVSRSAVVVGSALLANRISNLTDIEATFLQRDSKFKALLRLLRPYQWSKNLLVFVPIVTANAVGELGAWRRCALLFVGFSLMASAIYMLNDLTDLEADRLHPRKKTRPFASGSIPLWTSLAFGVPAIALAALAAAMSGGLWLLLLYGLGSIAYSLRLKQFPLVDVFLLAGLYGLRVFAGGISSGHPVSIWLFTFLVFLFFSLATVKRVAELISPGSAPNSRMGTRRGYSSGDVLLIQMMGIGSSFVSCLVLSLYVQSPTVTQSYPSPVFLWGMVPLSLFWQCRMWLSTSRGYMHDDPIVYAVKDWVSWLVLLCTAALMTLARTTFLR